MSSGQIIKEFLIESFENLSNINEQLTQYENDKQNKELLNSIYRKVHTLKGSANFLNFKKLQEITHVCENILDLLREEKREICSELTDLLLKSFDSCLSILNEIEKSGDEGAFETAPLLSELVKYGTENTNHEKFGVDESLLSLGITHQEEWPVGNEESGLKIVVPEGESEKKSPEVENKQDTEEESPKEVKESSTPVKNISDSVVRVNVELLDKIMNVVGELVLNRNQILQYAGSNEDSELTRLAQQLNGITTELQTDIMTTRMQPVGSVFSKFERVVRDLSRSQNKKIKLSVEGKDTELDKTLLDAIRDPLTHLIRNAADHGVEGPEQRKSSGKSEEGHIQIRAYHEGGQVTIEIQDDGQGLDPDKIAKKAVEKGILRSEEIPHMTKKQLQSLVMMPGFSTADKVTNISGRGVGMDVVKSNIEKIGGSVDISSEIGRGSTFKLKIPLTLAIVPALVVEAKSETFAIPQINLVELVRVEDEQIDKMIQKIHENEFFRLRGNLIPIFRLGKELEIIDPLQDPIAKEEEVSSIDTSLNIAVLSAEGVTYGLIVDQVLDTQEIVVKPLAKSLKELSVFAGATIMGDGRVSLIVDALGFYHKVSNGSLNKTIRKNILEEENSKPIDYSESKEILLAQLADGHDYGIPLVLVSRLEEISLERIEWSGECPLVRYRDKTMPLIDLESALGLNAKSILCDLKNEHEKHEKFDCVVVKTSGHYFGLVVKAIKDIAITDADVNTDIIAHPGMMGTVFIGDKTRTVLDIHKIIKDLKLITNDSSPGVSKGRILLVEDSPLYQRVQSEFFIEQGFEVVVEDNGKKGLERFQRENFDLVVTDIEMPEMNGWEFATAVRALTDKFLSQKPIVAVSTRVSPADLEKGVKSGFTKHLEKFDKDEVLQAINFCLAS